MKSGSMNAFSLRRKKPFPVRKEARNESFSES